MQEVRHPSLLLPKIKDIYLIPYEAHSVRIRQSQYFKSSNQFIFIYCIHFVDIMKDLKGKSYILPHSADMSL